MVSDRYCECGHGENMLQNENIAHTQSSLQILSDPRPVISPSPMTQYRPDLDPRRPNTKRIAILDDPTPTGLRFSKCDQQRRRLRERREVRSRKVRPLKSLEDRDNRKTIHSKVKHKKTSRKPCPSSIFREQSEDLQNRLYRIRGQPSSQQTK
jgi:hypothetical protein